MKTATYLLRYWPYLFIAGIVLTSVLLTKSEPKPQIPPYEPRIPIARLSTVQTDSPAKEEREFYLTYNERDVQYDVTPLTINKTGEQKYGDHSFQINYLNATDKIVDIRPYKDTLDIGCIATAATTVKETPVIFGGVLKSIDNFAPVQDIAIDLRLPVECTYIGTQDLQYSWPVSLD